MGGRRGKKWFEMQNVSFDTLAVFSGQNGIIVKKFDNFVRSFKFGSQFSVLVQEVMDTHKHLLMQQKIVNLGMLVKRTFLMGFLTSLCRTAAGCSLAKFVRGAVMSVNRCLESR